MISEKMNKKWSEEKWIDEGFLGTVKGLIILKINLEMGELYCV